MLHHVNGKILHVYIHLNEHYCIQEFLSATKHTLLTLSLIFTQIEQTSIFQVVCVVEQTGCSLTLSEISKTGFLTSRPILY